ncbi:MAG: YqeG family HAD IIIA-type phosphatase [Armatimonadota bacterium]
MAPRAVAPSLADVDIDALKAEGIRGLILDLDNTITSWRSLEVSDGILEWLDRARAAGLALCIISNSSKSRRVAELSERLGMPASARPGLKPFGPGFRRGLEMLGTPPEATAAIGDQIFSDVLGGNRDGLYTVFVEPMSRSEFVATKLVRVVERVALWLLRRRGMLPESASVGPLPEPQSQPEEEPKA